MSLSILGLQASVSSTCRVSILAAPVRGTLYDIRSDDMNSQASKPGTAYLPWNVSLTRHSALGSLDAYLTPAVADKPPAPSRHDHTYSTSTGLFTPRPPRFRTWV